MAGTNAAPTFPARGVPLALAALAFAVYGRVAGHAFLLNWDDLTYVVANETVRGLTWPHVRAAFAGAYFGNYAPLHLLSYALDHSLWGANPGAFLLTNVALHAASGALLYGLLRRLGLPWPGAALAAAVFLVHPVQVESVAWVSERKNVLCMTFSLAALHAWVSYRSLETGRRWLAYAGALLAVAAALLTKAVAVVVPPALVLLDLCHVERGRRPHWIADKVPFALAAAGLVAATLASQESMIAAGRAGFRLEGWSALFTMTPVVAHYVGLVLWPVHLSALYEPALRDVPDGAFWASAALVAVLAALGVVLWRRGRAAFLWYALFFVALVPVLHIVPLPTLMQDRYLYFPMLGAAALAGIGLERLEALAAPRARPAVLAGAAVLCVALASGAFVRTGVWRNDLSLWRDTTEKTPESTFAWVQLGVSLLDAGMKAEGLSAYRRALELNPDDVIALGNLGAAYNDLDQPEAGRPFLLRAVQVAPRRFEAHMSLGLGYWMSGDLGGAERAFAAALSIRPEDPAARKALLQVRSGRAEDR